MLDLSLPKLLVLAVIALAVFGQKDLPKIAARAGRTLRELRRLADAAKADLREGLGPEFSDFDIEDLNPRRFLHKHLLSEPSQHDPDETNASGKPPSAALPTGEEPSHHARQ